MKRGSVLKKSGAMELSFGMIFSVILIVIFLALAFYAIKKVLDTQNFIRINTAIDHLQEQIDDMHENSGGNYESPSEATFPSSIKNVCFIDYNCGSTSSRGCLRGRGSSEIYSAMEDYFNDDENIFFYPEKSSEGIDSMHIENINLEEITKTTNPYCIDTVDGKLKVTLKRIEGSSLIIVEKNN